MRAANITTVIAVLLWFGLVLMGRSLEGEVALRMGGSVNIGQFDYYVLWPTYISAGLLACAWACNTFRRGYRLLTGLAGLALVALLPFMMIYSGGV